LTRFAILSQACPVKVLLQRREQAFLNAVTGEVE
jgi:hypothetical protein